MIDYIDEIDCCVKSDIADGCAKDVYGYTTVERMGELIARLRQAEIDAARYRWLRDECFGDWEVGGVEVSHIEVTMWENDGFDNCSFGGSLHGAEMDSAIDEAMSGSSGGDL